jgi:C_GCAxxG_C_C family probable redox protein
VSDPQVVDRARALFLTDENTHGCAETALVVLQELYALDDPTNSSAAMALNGGVAYSGATCGAITGAALAVGRLAGRRLADHREAKRTARQITQHLMDEFAVTFGAVNCKDLTGYDLRADHDAFIQSGIWRDRCIRQIEFAIARLAPLADREQWEAKMRRLAGAAAGGG